ncbi:mitochondrial import receptor subunit Tom22, partial [Spiromyces aspiralis]
MSFAKTSGIREIPDDYVSDSDSNYITEDESVVSGLFDGEDDEEEDYEDDEIIDETLSERIAALKDVIPAHHRNSIYNFSRRVYDLGSTGMQLAGKLTWVLTTSALLVVFPLALETDREQMLVQWEKEQKMLGQQPGEGAGSQPGTL